MNNYAFPRIPSTPEQATANVALEADFHEKATDLKVERNNALNVLRNKRNKVKEAAHLSIQNIKHAWTIEKANIHMQIDRLVDERANLRREIHDGFADDNSQLLALTEQIHELRIKLANQDMECNNRIKEVKDSLNDAIHDLGKETIAIQENFHRRHSQLRMQLNEQVQVNRAKAYAAHKAQEGGEQ